MRVGVRDASQRGEHPAGEKPPTQQTEHQQERQHCDCCLAEGLLVGERPGANAPPMPDLVALTIGTWGKYRMRTIHRAISKAPASTRNPA